MLLKWCHDHLLPSFSGKNLVHAQSSHADLPAHPLASLLNNLNAFNDCTKPICQFHIPTSEPVTLGHAMSSWVLFIHVSMMGNRSWLLVLNFFSKEGVFILIDYALIVAVMHGMLGLLNMSSEMKISCKLSLLIPFCLCILDLWCLYLIVFFLLICRFIIVAIPL